MTGCLLTRTISEKQARAIGVTVHRRLSRFSRPKTYCLIEKLDHRKKWACRPWAAKPELNAGSRRPRFSPLNPPAANCSVFGRCDIGRAFGKDRRRRDCSIIDGCESTNCRRCPSFYDSVRRFRLASIHSASRSPLRTMIFAPAGSGLVTVYLKTAPVISPLASMHFRRHDPGSLYWVFQKNVGSKIVGIFEK
jgi:hypothetical protein